MPFTLILKRGHTWQGLLQTYCTFVTNHFWEDQSPKLPDTPTLGDRVGASVSLIMCELGFEACCCRSTLQLGAKSLFPKEERDPSSQPMTRFTTLQLQSLKPWTPCSLTHSVVHMIIYKLARSETIPIIEI